MRELGRSLGWSTSILAEFRTEEYSFPSAMDLVLFCITLKVAISTENGKGTFWTEMKGLHRIFNFVHTFKLTLMLIYSHFLQWMHSQVKFWDINERSSISSMSASFFPFPALIFALTFKNTDLAARKGIRLDPLRNRMCDLEKANRLLTDSAPLLACNRQEGYESRSWTLLHLWFL